MRRRADIIEKMKTEQADVLVIGGGITGAGIALDAQSRGIRTYLIEMQDFAAGTSSRSTKLIHGGLRYLKQFQLGVVAETGRERAIVYENARHITHPEWMMLPIYRSGTYGRLASSIGILVYDILAGVRKSERRQMLSREETLLREPLLCSDGLKGSGYYVEYRTDDARLTIEVIKKAAELGADVVNYVKVVNFLYTQGRLTGVQCLDVIRNQRFTIEAKKIVNATGPWVDELREKDKSKQGKCLHWTKGVHVVVSRKKLPLQQPLYFDTLDGRMIFAIPRENTVYIGTTDTNYTGNLERPMVTGEDAAYLLFAANRMFPSIKIKSTDIASSWAGIRPLIHEEGKSPSEISRKDEIFYSPSGLVTIAGGKLTGYRKMAERVVDSIARELRKDGRVIPKCYTDRIILSGGEVGDMNLYIERNVTEGMRLGLSKEEAMKLTSRYGSNVSLVYKLLEEGYKEATEHGLSLEVYGSLLYGLQHEMVTTPADFLVRRTGGLLFDIDWANKWKTPVTSYMQQYFQWDETYFEQNVKRLDIEVEQFTPNFC